MALIKGSNKDDNLNNGTAGNDNIVTSIGNDYVQASSGSDTVNLGFKSSSSYVRFGYNDFDTIDYRQAWSSAGLASSSSLSVVADLKAGTVKKYATGSLLGTDTVSSVDALSGTDGNDTLRGRDFWLYEEFKGYGGNDMIDGRGGDDGVIYSHATQSGITVDMAKGTVTSTDADIGTDTLREVENVIGTQFADRYVATGYGASSANRNSFGGEWNHFSPLGGDDVVIGNGSTGLNFSGAGGAITIDLSGQVIGSQVSVVKAFENIDGKGFVPGSISASGVYSIIGGAYDDQLIGGARVNSNGTNAAYSVHGDASMELFQGRAGDDTIKGGSGWDRATYSRQTALSEGIVVKLAAGTVIGDPIVVGNDTLRGIESIKSTHLDDFYDATGFTLSNAVAPSVNSGDVIVGVPAGETLPSKAFNEFIVAGGNDKVTGNGATRVNLDAHVEILSGVSSQVSFNSAQSGSASYGLTDGGLGRVDFTGVYAIRGSVGNDSIIGAAGFQRLQGGYGNDTLRGGDGADVLHGYIGGDKDAINLTTLYSDNDVLDGGKGSDKLVGDFGDDMLSGGLGIDTLEGGTGKDRFVFDTAIGSTNIDTITDFISGTDKIILDDDVFTKLGVTGTAAGVALPTARFQVGKVANDTGDRIVYEQATGKLYYDADGSGGGAAVQIALVGTASHPALTAADFLIVA